MGDPDNLCSRCGAPLPACTAGGFCPRCLLRLGVVEGAASEDEPATVSSDPDSVPADLRHAQGVTRDFGEYALLDEIGRGGMGVVYRAHQKRLERVVALKLILAGNWASLEQVRRFQTEARAAAGLAHPNIVKVFDTGEVGGQPYIAMEYVRGRNLAHALKSGTLRIEDSARLVRVVAGALDYLHRNGIVHRDLKPANILLDEADRPYVTDFGLALFRDDVATRTSVVAGTPCYMSPEQAAGRIGEVDARSDVYSLGAVLYELLTGRPPALAGNPLETLVQAIERDPPPPRQLNRRVPRDLEWICLKCLSKRPLDRYLTAADLGEDLDRFLASEPVAARAPGVVRRAGRWARREPALAIRLAGMALFYLVELKNYYLYRTIEYEWHRDVSLVILVWAAASAGLQQVLKQERWETVAIYLWGAVDVAAVTTLLLLANGAASPLVVIYAVLVAASGLWLRPGVVTFTTATAIVSYLLLVADFFFRRTWLQTVLDSDPDRHVDFLLALVLIGVAVRYQVRRARALSHFFASRRPPWLRRGD